MAALGEAAGRILSPAPTLFAEPLLWEDHSVLQMKDVNVPPWATLPVPDIARSPRHWPTMGRR
ncbi:hypothetical protein SGLAM104S_01702 [Streptomyces glaucescens]|jgi:hypothetical protein